MRRLPALLGYSYEDNLSPKLDRLQAWLGVGVGLTLTLTLTLTLALTLTRPSCG